MHELSPYEKGFLEALIDAEGSILFFSVPDRSGKNGRSWRLRLSISNTNRELLEKAKSFLGNHSWGIQTLPKRNPKHKWGYRLELGQTHMEWLLPRIELVVKERQRQVAVNILYCLRRERTLLPTLYDLMRKLNRRGA